MNIQDTREYSPDKDAMNMVAIHQKTMFIISLRRDA